MMFKTDQVEMQYIRRSIFQRRNSRAGRHGSSYLLLLAAIVTLPCLQSSCSGSVGLSDIVVVNPDQKECCCELIKYVGGSAFNGEETSAMQKAKQAVKEAGGNAMLVTHADKHGGLTSISVQALFCDFEQMKKFDLDKDSNDTQ